tara:strand:+ start:681 stop:1370 length:690 start_codon:yes stop_codon:yes gene_type:complete
MENFISFNEFLTQSGNNISPINFALNLLLAAFLSLILKKIYVNFGTALSNRDLFSNNFVMITLTTMVVISIVKASLALSLGLVGALSIVRFRAAIKEPEELSYLFLAIAIGLGLGANQIYVTLIGFSIISLVVIINSYFIKRVNGNESNGNIYIQISSNNKIEVDKIVELFLFHCDSVFLKRLDEDDTSIEASFLVKFNDFKNLDNAKKDIQKIDPTIKITFLDYNQPI